MGRTVDRPVVRVCPHFLPDGSIIRVRQWGSHSFDAIIEPPGFTTGWRLDGGMWPTHPQALQAAYVSLRAAGRGWGGDVSAGELEAWAHVYRQPEPESARTLPGVSILIVIGVSGLAALAAGVGLMAGLFGVFR